MTDSIERITTAVSHKNERLWEEEAYIKYYTRKCEETEKEIKDELQQQQEIAEELESTNVEIEKLEFCYEIALEEFKGDCSDISLLTELLRFRENELKDLETQRNAILEEAEQSYEKRKEALEHSSEMYQNLVAVRAEVKKIKVQCKIHEQQIKNLTEQHKMRDAIKKQIFYNEMVNFAKGCLEVRKVEQLEMELQQAKEKEQQLFQEVMELQEKARNASAVKRTVEETIPKEPIEDRKAKLNENILKFLQSTEHITPVRDLPPLPSAPKEDKPKVNILNVQTIKPTIKAPVKQLSSVEKFTRFVKNFSKRSSNNSQEISSSQKRLKSLNASLASPSASQEKDMEIASQENKTKKSVKKQVRIASPKVQQANSKGASDKAIFKAPKEPNVHQIAKGLLQHVNPDKGFTFSEKTKSSQNIYDPMQFQSNLESQTNTEVSTINEPRATQSFGFSGFTGNSEVNFDFMGTTDGKPFQFQGFPEDDNAFQFGQFPLFK